MPPPVAVPDSDSRSVVSASTAPSFTAAVTVTCVAASDSVRLVGLTLSEIDVEALSLSAIETVTGFTTNPVAVPPSTIVSAPSTSRSWVVAMVTSAVALAWFSAMEMVGRLASSV